MPEPLSIVSLIVGATPLVQLVMLLLLLASLVSWYMIFQRMILFGRVQRSIDEFEDHFWSGIDLRGFHQELSELEDELTGMENLFVSGFGEFVRLRGTEPEAIVQGVQRAMRVALLQEEDRLSRNLGFLATVGSTSPYIGLFGTVWGIMNAFRSLANLTQASLTAVAPGISEALIATAMGLFAAIPAVIAYNRFSVRVEDLRNRYEVFVEAFMGMMHRAAHGSSREAQS